MKQAKIDNTMREQLFSVRPDAVLAAIEKLTATGNHAYLPILFELLASQPESGIREAILKLLGTVKDNECIAEFIGALQNDHFKDIRKEIITCCWQNGLDFSPFMGVFADLVIHEDWETAFEAFTVIENLEFFPPAEELHSIRLRVAGALKSADEKKQYFLEEILRMEH